MKDIEKSWEQYHHLGTAVRTDSLSAPKEQLFLSLKANHAQHVSASRLLTSSDLLLRSKPDTQPLVITVTSNTESAPTGPARDLLSVSGNLALLVHLTTPSPSSHLILC